MRGERFVPCSRVLVILGQPLAVCCHFGRGIAVAGNALPVAGGHHSMSTGERTCFGGTLGILPRNGVVIAR